MSDEQRWKTLGRGKRVARKTALPCSTKVSVRHLRQDDIDVWRQMAALAGLSSLGELIYHAMRALCSNPQWKKLMVDSVNNFRALVNSELTTALVDEKGKPQTITPEIAKEYLERTGRVVWGNREIRLVTVLRKARTLEAISAYQLTGDDLKILKRWSKLGLWTVKDPSGSGEIRLTPYGRKIFAAAMGERDIVTLNDINDAEDDE